MARELIDILVDLARIVEGLSDDPDFSGGWQIGGIVKELEAIQSAQQVCPTGQDERG